MTGGRFPGSVRWSPRARCRQLASGYHGLPVSHGLPHICHVLISLEPSTLLDKGPVVITLLNSLSLNAITSEELGARTAADKLWGTRIHHCLSYFSCDKTAD